jgi:hypothetical protein
VLSVRGGGGVVWSVVWGVGRLGRGGRGLGLNECLGGCGRLRDGRMCELLWKILRRRKRCFEEG